MSRVHDAFDDIHAEEALKERTLAAIEARVAAARGRSARPRRPVAVRGLAVAACLLVALLGAGTGVCLTPTAVISVDVNPSVELGINRFDRVVYAKGMNEDGERLVDSVDVWGSTYDEAVERLLDSDQVAGLLEEGALADVTVVDSGTEQCERLLAGVEACTRGREGTSCHAAAEGDVAAAHDEGLSYGKYRVLLEIQELDPEVTADDVRDLTMRELHELLDSLGGAGTSTEEALASGGQSGHGGRHQHGR